MKNTHLNLNRKTKSTLTQIALVCVSFLLALIVGAVLLMVQGHDVMKAYYCLLIQPFTSMSNIAKVLAKSTPLIFAGLSVAVAFKCDVFNIGVEGQLYAGALAAAWLGTTITGLPPVLHIIVCFLGAAIVGGILAYIPGLLKVEFGVHEVISTIMMNYVINNIVTLLIVDYFRADAPTARTPYVQESAYLTNFAPPSQLNSGIFLALLLVVAMYILFQKSSFGWRLQAAGQNMTATRYVGINSKRTILLTMLISGALAGFLGAERVLGGFRYCQVNFSPGYGYDGIAVAVIANNDPFGCLIMALLMGLLSHGGTTLSVMTDVPSEWVNVLSAFVFLFVVASKAILAKLPEWKEKRTLKERRREA